MKLLVHLVLWMGWLLLGCFVVASIFMLREPIESSEPDQVLKIALPITGTIGFLFGMGALHIRKHLFWFRRKITIGDPSGRAIFLGFSIAAMTGAGLSALAFFAPRLLWGWTKMPIVGIAIGLVFLIGLFPRLPKEHEDFEE